MRDFNLPSADGIPPDQGAQQEAIFRQGKPRPRVGGIMVKGFTGKDFEHKMLAQSTNGGRGGRCRSRNKDNLSGVTQCPYRTNVSKQLETSVPPSCRENQACTGKPATVSGSLSIVFPPAQHIIRESAGIMRDGLVRMGRSGIRLLPRPLEPYILHPPILELADENLAGGTRKIDLPRGSVGNFPHQFSEATYHTRFALSPEYTTNERGYCSPLFGRHCERKGREKTLYVKKGCSIELPNKSPK